MTKGNVIGVGVVQMGEPKDTEEEYLQGVVLIAGLGIGIRHLALTPGLLLNSAVILGEAFNLLESTIWV